MFTSGENFMKGKGILLVFMFLIITTPLFATSLQDFSFKDINGKTFHLFDMKGKPVVVNIGSHWWNKCKVEAPELQRAYSIYKDQGVQFLGVFVMSEEKDIREFAEKYQLSFPVGKDSGITLALGAKTIPETIFINKEGDILQRHTGTIHFDGLKASIEEIA